MSTDLDEALARAIERLAAGHVIGMPTETVYGLAADALNPDAVRRIFALKGRPADHPLIVHVADATALDRFAHDVSPDARKLAATFWPGPLTLIVRRSAQIPDVVTGGRDTVGLRAPSHPIAATLLRRFAQRHSGALAAPSANRFGRISPTTPEHVRQEFGDRLDVVLDGGACQVGIESTIVDVSSPRPALLRPGHIGREQLQACLGNTIDHPSTPTVAAPGTLASHYAPSTPLWLVDSAQVPDLLDQTDEPIALLTRDPHREHCVAAEHPHVRVVAMPTDPSAYARCLYATMRAVDDGSWARIVVVAPPVEPRWLAVRDRLQRAAAEHDPPKLPFDPA